MNLPMKIRMPQSSRNIKFEMQKIGALLLILVLLVCGVLIFTVQKATSTLTLIDQFGSLTSLVNEYQNVLERTIFSYKILATGSSTESMKTLDQLKFLDLKALQIKKIIDQKADLSTEIGFQASEFSKKTTELIVASKKDGQAMVLAFLDSKDKEGKAAAAKLQNDAIQLDSLINRFEESVPKLSLEERASSLEFLNTIRRWSIALSIFTILLISYLFTYLFRFTNVSLTKIVASLKREINILSSTTFAVSTISEAISGGSDHQANIVSQTNLALLRMSEMLKKTSEFAMESESVMTNANFRANNGMKIMGQVVTTMTAVESANEKLQTMNQIMQEISNKTKVINDIVFKTQILSFNASIEAARAGQHGRGISVVAEEVGNLAKISGLAAQEISILLSNSEKQVSELISYTHNCVIQGKEVTGKAMNNFKEITNDIVLISKQINSIVEAAREQELGVTQTHQAMNDLNITTNQNNEVSHNAFETSQILIEKVNALDKISKAIEISLTGSPKTAKSSILSFRKKQHLDKNQNTNPKKIA